MEIQDQKVSVKEYNSSFESIPMKRFIGLLNVLLFFTICTVVAQQEQGRGVRRLEIPRVEKGEHVITHTGYSFLYDEHHEQACWVAYELTREETVKSYERTNRFKPDPSVSSQTADDADYAGSGYDKGHLAPAADMGWSEVAMAESFYYSNMSPQEPGFNRGIWKKLEEQVRSWAVENQSVLIVTGPVLKKGLRSIGPDQVSVPEHYYKVILDHGEPEIKAIAFLIPNASQSAALSSFVVSIDSVEQVTGIDFFPGFEQEAMVEKVSDAHQWSWTGSSSRVTAQGKVPDATVIRTSQSVQAPANGQCRGLTKAGTRCKNKTQNPSGYCHLHEGQAKGK